MHEVNETMGLHHVEQFRASGNDRPKYSICICNYNMSDTLEVSLRSVLDQLNETYEVLVVDDGSTDNSMTILSSLLQEYSNLRVRRLSRKWSRQLGETRNVSVREARGEYVLLHIDADDVWEPHIPDFVRVFHRIEKCLGYDVLLSGQQINMAKRSFLMKHGPYRNTHRAQDRDMWLRFAAMGLYLPLDHRVFRKRLTRPRKVQTLKSVRDGWFHMLYDMRRGTDLGQYITGCLTGPFVPRSGNFSFKVRVMRFFIALPAFLVSRTCEPLPPPSNMRTHEEFVKYRESARGRYADIMRRNGCPDDLDFVSPEARTIFETRPQA